MTRLGECGLPHRTDLAKAVADFRWPGSSTSTGPGPLRHGRRPARPHRTAHRRDRRTADGPDDRLPRAVPPLGTGRQLAVHTGGAPRRPVLLMLGNRVKVWETMPAAIKRGAVVIPTYTTVTAAELRDRLDRGGVRHVIAEAHLTPRFGPFTGEWTGIAVGGEAAGRQRTRTPAPHPRTSPPTRRPGRTTRSSATSLRHHVPVEDGGAHPRQLPRRPPLRHVRERCAPRGRAPQHLRAGMGQARLELALRTVDRRGDRARAGHRPQHS